MGTDMFEAESEERYAALATHFADTQRGFTPATVYARDVERVEHLPNVTLALIKRGFSDQDILKVLGGNHLRLFQQTWN